MKRWIAHVLVATLLSTSQARASDQAFLQVSQPLPSRVSQCCVQVGHVMYQTYLGSTSPGIEIGYTCTRSPVGSIIEGPSGSSDARIEMRDFNAASLLGFKIVVENRIDPATWDVARKRTDEIVAHHAFPREAGPGEMYVIDTLRVRLDISAAVDSVRGRGEGSWECRPELDSALAATVDCILDNAAHGRVPIRHLLLDVVGPSKSRRYSGLYQVKPPQLREYCPEPKRAGDVRERRVQR